MQVRSCLTLSISRLFSKHFYIPNRWSTATGVLGKSFIIPILTVNTFIDLVFILDVPINVNSITTIKNKVVCKA